MRGKVFTWISAGLLLIIGIIHLNLAPGEYSEAPYLAALFAANFLLAVIASVGVRYQKPWGWLLGLVVASGSILGYVWSRTTGLPGMQLEGWLTAWGIISMVLEVLFILITLITNPIRTPMKMGGLVLTSSFIASISIISVSLIFASSRTVTIGEAQLEEQYGLRIERVSRSNLDAIVDYRLKIIDASKASMLLGNGMMAGHKASPTLYIVNTGQTVTAPAMHHMATKLRDNHIFFIFFPNPGRQVQSGTEVALQFGNIRVTPVAVK